MIADRSRLNRALLRRVLITDRRGPGSGDLAADVARRCRVFGVTLVMLREKDLEPPALLALAREVVLAAPVPVIVSHRPSVAVAAGAVGVHLGGTSPSVRAARATVGDALAIGVSIHDPSEAGAAVRAGADYLLFGSVHDTPKPDGLSRGQGLRRLAEAVAIAGIPVIAVGGLGPDDEARILETGAAGLAAIRAFAAEPLRGRP